MKNKENLLSHFEVQDKKRKLAYGGMTQRKRKSQRPFSRNKPIHPVLKSELSKNEKSFRLYKIWIEKLIRSKAQTHFVEVSDLVIMGHHLHIKLKALARNEFQKYLKVITSLVARHITKAQKGKAYLLYFSGRPICKI